MRCSGCIWPTLSSTGSPSGTSPWRSISRPASPDLKKTGELRALRRISKVGRVSYDVLSFSGDNMIKKDVIARYISAEVKSTARRKR